MDATLIVIDSDEELGRARALVDRLMTSEEPGDIIRLRAQARLIASYEEERWPTRRPQPADVIRYLAEQHGLNRSDLAPLFGGREKLTEVLRGKRELTLAMIKRLRARFRVPADLLLPPNVEPGTRRSPKRSAA